MEVLLGKERSTLPLKKGLVQVSENEFGVPCPRHCVCDLTHLQLSNWRVPYKSQFWHFKLSGGVLKGITLP